MTESWQRLVDQLQRILVSDEPFLKMGRNAYVYLGRSYVISGPVVLTMLLAGWGFIGGCSCFM